jgi:uncharacterized membrane protein YgdD (TMEM256/DUF423 family)
MKPPRLLPALAAANAIIALLFGAFAAHAIKDPVAQAWIRTGVIFQLPHVAAVFGLLAWRNVRAVLAPVGGGMMILGWLWLLFVMLRGVED